MNLNTRRDFIVIDDDHINNMICSKMIALAIPDSEISTFILPEEGLRFIEAYKPVADKPNAVLFLDINMPSLSGWDVLDKMVTMPETLKNSIDTYMLSSSVDQYDRQKADNHPLVKGYISKPLTRAKILAVSLGEQA